MLLECKNVSKKFPGPKGNTSLSVLQNISFSINNGESCAITGPSGSGKSTLLHILGLLEPPTGGTIHFAGQDSYAASGKQQAQLRNRHIGFVFQSYFLLPQLTVLENVLIPLLPEKDTQLRKNAEQRAVRLLKRVGLESHLLYRPGELSGGQQLRTAIVRALVREPQLLLADEPTGSLDQTTAEKIGELLAEINTEEQTALIVVTHSSALASKMKHQYKLDHGLLQKSKKI